MTTLGLFHATLRRDEKLILEAAERRGVRVETIDVRGEAFNPETWTADFDIALERSVSTVKGAYVAEFLESLNVPVVNGPAVIRVCQDKFLTSLRLAACRVPTVPFALAFDLPRARRAVEELGGYPVVVKPPLGSWGRLLAKVNDDDALEAVLEHKDVLGSPQQKAFYIQAFIPKPGRDIRAFVAGREPVCAVARESGHWITNTARGGTTQAYPLDDGLRDLCRRTADAVGHGLLALDIFETPGGPVVNEVNHTMEFKNSEEPTGVSISGAIVDYCLAILNAG